MKVCPQCQTENRKNAIYCKECCNFSPFDGYAQQGGNCIRDYSIEKPASEIYNAKVISLRCSNIQEIFSDCQILIVKSCDSVLAFDIDVLWNNNIVGTPVPVWKKKIIDAKMMLLRPFVILVDNLGMKYIHIPSGNLFDYNFENEMMIVNENVSAFLSIDYYSDVFVRMGFVAYDNNLLGLSIGKFNKFENYRILTLSDDQPILGVNGIDRHSILVYFEDGKYTRFSTKDFFSADSKQNVDSLRQLPNFTEGDKVLNMWQFKDVYYSSTIDFEGIVTLQAWKENEVLFKKAVEQNDLSLEKLPQRNSVLFNQFYINKNNEFKCIYDGKVWQLHVLNHDLYGLAINDSNIEWKHHSFLNLKQKHIALIPCLPEWQARSGATHLLASFEIQDFDKLHPAVLSQVYIEEIVNDFPLLCNASEYLIAANGATIAIFKPQGK